MIVQVNEVDYEIEIIPPDLGIVEVTSPSLGYLTAEGNLETQVFVNDEDLIIENNIFTVVIDESPSIVIDPVEIINEVIVSPEVTYVVVNSVGIQGPPGSGTADEILDLTSITSDDITEGTTNLFLSIEERTAIANIADGGVDRHYTHAQDIETAVWSINHNLGKYPAVHVVDSAGTVVIAEIDQIDTNNLTVTFAYATTGKVYCN